MDELFRKRVLDSAEASMYSKELTSDKSVRTRTCTTTTRITLKPDPSEINKNFRDVLPSELYIDTNLQLKEHENYSPNPGRTHSMDDMFSLRAQDMKLAEIIIMSGEEGSGKTMLLRVLRERYEDPEQSISHLEPETLLMHADLQKQEYSNFAEFASDTFKACFGEKISGNKRAVNSIVLSRKIVVALDGFDDSMCDRNGLCREAIQLKGTKKRVVITCRPQYVDTLYSFVPKSKIKRVLHLVLNGIHPSCMLIFVNRYMNIQKLFNSTEMSGPRKRPLELIKKGIKTKLDEIHGLLNYKMYNPLMLVLLTNMWLENPMIKLDSHETPLFVNKDKFKSEENS